ncbi:hypothetical protein G6514_001117 [Epicoccum nigrum]|nr:hypothetical protein G6514_001117 [Epicoccum nigrum]
MGLLFSILFEIREPIDLDSLREGTGTIRDKKFRSWAVPFGLFLRRSRVVTTEPEEEPNVLDLVIPMQAPDACVDTPEVFNAVKLHLRTCLVEHEECKKPDPAAQPTRLLYLDNNKKDRVFVQETHVGTRCAYAALSYRWGTTEQVKLSSAEVKNFSKKGVLVSSLPRTIQDAIFTTRQLGLMYLWVDTLCIIQDSTEDKDREVARMAVIYTNATITISAATAADCGDGFLHDRMEVALRLMAAMCLPVLATPDEETLEVVEWVYLCPDTYAGHKIKTFDEETISKRAWTYQETTLSPRLLIYGSGPPQWHCKEVWKIIGLRVHPSNLPNPNYTSGVMKITLENGSISANGTKKTVERPPPPLDEIGLWHTNWFPVLENYSRRGLTVQTDKLAALSAMAAEYSSQDKGKYAAGLWSASLPRSLLWRSSRFNPEGQTGDRSHGLTEVLSRLRGLRVEERSLDWLSSRVFDRSASKTPSDWLAKYVAPTWSPMSSREAIRFECYATQEENEHHTSLVKINDVHAELGTTNLHPYGRVNFAYLDMTGPLMPISWQDLTAQFVIVVDGEPFQYWDYIIPDDPSYFKGLSAKHAPSFNPQELADTNVKHPFIDGDDYSLLIGESKIRITNSVEPKPVSLECQKSTTKFDVLDDVKSTVFDALRREGGAASPSKGLRRSMHNLAIKLRSNEGKKARVADGSGLDFYLLEVERSTSPAGLVLKRVTGDVYARVGYFARNRDLDPEIVCLPGRVQVRGKRTFNWGRPDLKDTWSEDLKLTRFYLV